MPSRSTPSTLSSIVSRLAKLPKAARREFLAQLSERERLAVLEELYRWERWARSEQLEPPGEWSVWLNLAGRGNGKTRTLCEWVRYRVERCGARRLVIAASTSADVRDTVVEGESGLLAVFPPHRRPLYEPSKRRVTFAGGARAVLLSADRPDRFRGPQCDTAAADELAAWRYSEAWENLLLGLRLETSKGVGPRAGVATTPRPTRQIRELKADPATCTTVGRTVDNRGNLAPAFFDRIIRRYQGTRLGRQELDAEILEEIEGAIVTLAMIDDARVAELPELGRVVVAVDPPGGHKATSAEAGIVAAGRGAGSDAEQGYVLEDRSLRGTPDEWARAAIRLHRELDADAIVAEVNHGGDMVKDVIRSRDRSVRVIEVRASRAKHVRFEPIGALYEQFRIHHLGTFAALEDQVCGFTSTGYEGAGSEDSENPASPDRADALVWALTELLVSRGSGFEIYAGEAAA
jgi:phage terminase large subunit-like protein